MDSKKQQTPITSFNFEGKEQGVIFVETSKINDGVECDIYAFVGDDSKDLGIIKIKPGHRTPLQKVLKGDRTIEGHISGQGKLTIIGNNGKRQIYEVSNGIKKPVMVTVKIGELMQWEAALNSNLTVYEICFPPYRDGRFENIG